MLGIVWWLSNHSGAFYLQSATSDASPEFVSSTGWHKDVTTVGTPRDSPERAGEREVWANLVFES